LNDHSSGIVYIYGVARVGTADIIYTQKRRTADSALPPMVEVRLAAVRPVSFWLVFGIVLMFFLLQAWIVSFVAVMGSLYPARWRMNILRRSCCGCCVVEQPLCVL
jgi:hypothetical protein